MYVLLQIVTVTSAAIAMALPLAHLLEWPGKLRLSREQYMAMQRAYYPGFTYAGLVEPLAVLLAFVLVLWTPPTTPPFWLAAASVILLGAMHGSYWLLTHPINRFWMAEARLASAGARFFGSERLPFERLQAEGNWRELRRRWELSHGLRAALGFAALVLLATAAAL